MKSIWNVLSVTSLVFVLAMGISQKTFAGQQQAQKELSPEEQQKVELEKLKAALTALLDQTNSAITADIAATKAKIQKMNDVKSQGNEIRQMLLVVTGQMSTYTSITFNLYVVALQDEPSAFPFILTAIKDDDVPPNLSWFEYMKDPANAPEFNSPLTLIDTISSRFGKIATLTQALVSPMAQNIFNKVMELENGAPSSVAPSQAPTSPHPFKMWDPGIIKTKSILKTLREKQTTT